ncbi:MAG: hypothetical protein PHZ26_03215 [Candidatus Gracilibacteria bacterium]|nr:hypothetical protein [Candidatus Gracilibacteria bacterium]MDD2908737.1 hypothetical protein [Candidatus Gracilibacteria bacterium]
MGIFEMRERAGKIRKDTNGFNTLVESEDIKRKISYLIHGNPEDKDIKIIKNKEQSNKLILSRINEYNLNLYKDKKEVLTILFHILIQEGYTVTDEIRNSGRDILGIDYLTQDEIIKSVEKDLELQESTGIPTLEEMPRELEIELREDITDVSVLIGEKEILRKGYVENKRNNDESEKIKREVLIVSTKIDDLLSKKDYNDALLLAQGLKNDFPKNSEVLAILRKVKKSVKKMK